MISTKLTVLMVVCGSVWSVPFDSSDVDKRDWWYNCAGGKMQINLNKLCSASNSQAPPPAERGFGNLWLMKQKSVGTIERSLDGREIRLTCVATGVQFNLTKICECANNAADEIETSQQPTTTYAVPSPEEERLLKEFFHALEK